MRGVLASILVLAAVSSAAGVSIAQKGLSTGPNLDGIDNARRIEENKLRALEVSRKAGLAALQVQDFTLAEKHFAELLAFDPTTSDASYLMGVTQIGLNKWAEAKQYLEVAVKNEPKRPEPKARLGVAHVMLSDFASATAQRTELASMASKCTGDCPDAKRIADNLAMIDRVLAAAQPKPAPAG